MEGICKKLPKFSETMYWNGQNFIHQNSKEAETGRQAWGKHEISNWSWEAALPLWGGRHLSEVGFERTVRGLPTSGRRYALWVFLGQPPEVQWALCSARVAHFKGMQLGLNHRETSHGVGRLRTEGSQVAGDKMALDHTGCESRPQVTFDELTPELPKHEHAEKHRTRWSPCRVSDWQGAIAQWCTVGFCVGWSSNSAAYLGGRSVQRYGSTRTSAGTELTFFLFSAMSTPPLTGQTPDSPSWRVLIYGNWVSSFPES